MLGNDVVARIEFKAIKESNGEGVEISYEVVNDTLSEVVLVPEYFYDGSWHRARVDGAEVDSVVFTRLYPDTMRYPGIRFRSGSSGSFRYARVEYSDNGRVFRFS